MFGAIHSVTVNSVYILLHADMLLFVWAVISGFRRSKGEWTRCCWQAVIPNFNLSTKSWNNVEDWRGENWREGIVSCNIGLSNIDDIKSVEDHLLLFMTSCEIPKGLSKGQTPKDLKLSQQDKAYKWFITMCSKGKPVSWFMATEKSKHFYDGIK